MNLQNEETQLASFFPTFIYDLIISNFLIGRGRNSGPPNLECLVSFPLSTFFELMTHGDLLVGLFLYKVLSFGIFCSSTKGVFFVEILSIKA